MGETRWVRRREPLLEEVGESEGRSERELGPPESDRRGSNPGSAA